MNYTVRLAKPNEIGHMAEIERSAATRFLPFLPQLNIPVSRLEGLTTLKFLRQAQAEDRLWVAVVDAPELSEKVEVVGFVAVKFLLESCFVVEIDVHADYSRQGMGSALMKACFEGTIARKFHKVTLTTFRHIPWNIPFYRQLGFSILPPEAWSNDIRAIVDHEARYGFARDTRVVMQRDLACEL